MNKTAVVSARIRPDVKSRTEKILDSLGLTTTDAITLLFNQIDMRKGLPFPVEIPNELTQQVLDEMDAGINIQTVATVADLMKEIEQ